MHYRRCYRCYQGNEGAGQTSPCSLLSMQPTLLLEPLEEGRGQGYYSQWADEEPEARRGRWKARTQTLEPVLFLVHHPLQPCMEEKQGLFLFPFEISDLCQVDGRSKS